MLDLGNKKLEKFSLSKELVGERVVLVPRTHEYDEALWRLIDSSREFLREYLFWVDDTNSLDDVKSVTSIFMKNWDNQDSFEYVFLDKKTKSLSGQGEFIPFVIFTIMLNMVIILIKMLLDTVMLPKLSNCLKKSCLAKEFTVCKLFVMLTIMHQPLLPNVVALSLKEQ